MNEIKYNVSSSEGSWPGNQFFLFHDEELFSR